MGHALDMFNVIMIIFGGFSLGAIAAICLFKGPKYLRNIDRVRLFIMLAASGWSIVFVAIYGIVHPQIVFMAVIGFLLMLIMIVLGIL